MALTRGLARHRARLAGFLITAVASALALAALSGPAAAHFDSGQWSHESSACSYSNTRLDPITIIFYNWGYADRSANSLNYHFGWHNDGATAQYFASHGNCLQNTHDPTSGGNPRYHIRIKKTYDGDSYWGVTSASTPHYERTVDCSIIPFTTQHAVYPNGFNDGRERIINGLYFRDGHGFWGYQWWGNTEPRVNQCNGDRAAADGYVGFIAQHYSFH
jgi:hypothetical protein